MRDANGTTIKTIKRQSRGRCPDGAPNPIDVYVGHRLKARRLLLGMSMDKLASLMGLTFQQIQNMNEAVTALAPAVCGTSAKFSALTLISFLKICRRTSRIRVRGILYMILISLTTATIIRCQRLLTEQMKLKNCYETILIYKTVLPLAAFFFC